MMKDFIMQDGVIFTKEDQVKVIRKMQKDIKDLRKQIELLNEMKEKTYEELFKDD